MTEPVEVSPTDEGLEEVEPVEWPVTDVDPSVEGTEGYKEEEDGSDG